MPTVTTFTAQENMVTQRVVGEGVGASDAPDVGPPPPAATFLVVGVGASAGGLEPLAALLRDLPADIELAVVVVMHLDPTHESGLTEILARSTAIRVLVAVDGALIEPGNVYVMPSNVNVLVDRGALRLEPRVEEAARNLPIDAFLLTLAKDVSARSVAVVLSGAGSDGARGVAAVREAGGLTIAQDGTAKYDSMPLAAVATGCVDLVLPPEAIARELLRVVRRSTPEEGRLHDDEALLREIFALLHEAGRMDFSHYKRASFRRRVQRRVHATHQSNLHEYVALLRADPAEAEALCEDVLVHVTGFFRDPSVFETLERTALPRLVERRARDAPLRVWVPGCSSGEEVYSIAICLLEYFANTGGGVPVKIFGTDASPSAVARARAGRYEKNIESEVSEGRLRRFFTESDGGYQIRRNVRDLCVFAAHDVTRDPPFSDMDLVSCRNLLIYFDAALQGSVIPVLHYALKPGGLLLLGVSESAGAFEGFSPLDPQARIYTRTGASGRPLGMTQGWPARTRDAPRPNPVPTSHLEVHQEADRVVLAEHGPPGVVITGDMNIVNFRGQTGPYVQHTPGPASLDLLRVARDDLRLALRQSIDEAKRSGSVARSTVPRAGEGGRDLEVEVLPFSIASSRPPLFVVLFRDTPAGVGPPEELVGALQHDVETRLQHELASTRAYLQSVVEQLEAGNEELRAANEEVVSSNEELRSTNDELQIAKEELQATNEELSTVNGELMARNVEATRLYDDLVNLLTSVAIPIVILGRDGRVRRFTPAAGRVLGLRATDAGRPFDDIRPRLGAVALAQTIAEVQGRLAPWEGAVRHEDGHWYQLSVHPYLTTDARVDGVTIALFDIDAIKRGEKLAADEFRQTLGEYQTKLQEASFNAQLAEGRERRRIAADLHDRIGQPLALAQMRLSAVRDGLQGAVRAEIDACMQLVASSVADTRTLTFELSPPILYDLGLKAAIEWLADHFATRFGLEVVVGGTDVASLDADVAAVLFRAVRELLTNVVKHARCARAKVTLGAGDDHVALAVEDAGAGFDAKASGSQRSRSFGLFSIREQISRLGGTVEVSSAVGEGTRVGLRIPLQARSSTGSETVEP